MTAVAPPPVLYPCPGLLAGWHLDPAGTPTALGGEAALRILAQGGPLCWLHFDLAHAGTRALLANAAPLPAEARLALTELDEHPWIEAGEASLHGSLPDIEAASDREPMAIGLLRFALTEQMLVTGRRHPLRALARFRAPPAATPPALLLARLIRAVLEDLRAAQRAAALRLEALEEVLLRRPGAADRAELAALRRDILRLGRSLEPLVLAAEGRTSDEELLPDWIDPAARPALLGALQRVRAAAAAVAALGDRARIAQDQLASDAVAATNRRLFVLSVISAVMLPASLVAGIFGMNVGNLPGVDSDWGFAGAMGLILGSIGGTIVLLRMFRLL